MANKSIKIPELETELHSNQQSWNAKGYTFTGNTYTGKINNQDKTPKNSYTGTSETSGSGSRSLISANNRGPIVYGPTEDDIFEIIAKYSTLVVDYGILTKFPWLNPEIQLNNYSASTQQILNDSSKVPVYKCLGKGYGEISFFKCGNAITGDESGAGVIYPDDRSAADPPGGSSLGITYGIQSSEYLSEQARYPFNGYIYSGTLVQIINEIDETTGISSPKIIPFQNGRGIPQYSSNYFPEGVEGVDGTTEYAPYGELTWTSGSTMSPALAEGIEPGESNFVVGMVLDSYSSTPGPDGVRVFKPEFPNGFTTEQIESDPNEPWYNKPAPQTISAVSYNTNLNENEPATQGFLSPGPNLSNNFYAPWPRYYAYQPDEAVPVLTSGITTARIGAAYNIALMSYGFKQEISPSDSIYVPQTCIPLFEGERLEAGSYIYASVKGHIMTPGPYQANDFSSGGTRAEVVVSEGVIGQTPWDIFADSTWGNFGWTGTPGLSFQGIPDQEVGIPEILGGEVIEYLNQANQGTIIVQAITDTGPSPATGNAYLQSEKEKTDTGFTGEEIEEIKRQRSELPGISGRCTLPQTVPEKAKPIGILMETVRGTGRWTYTGLVTDATVESSIATGGVAYGDPSTINNTEIRTSVGAGVAGELDGDVSWTVFDPLSPFLGTISEPLVLTDPGTHVAGEIVTIQDTSLTWYPDEEFQFLGNNCPLTIGAGDTVTLQSGGTGYTSGIGYTTQNISMNNMLIQFERIGADLLPNGTLAGSDYFQDFTRYNANTVIRVLNAKYPANYLNGFSLVNYFNVDDYPTYTSQNLSILRNASTEYNDPAASTDGIRFMETTQCNWDTINAAMEIEVLTFGANGEIETFNIIDYGSGHKEGDRILLINQSLVGAINAGPNNNGAIVYGGLPEGQQEIICTGPSYTDTNSYDLYTDGTVFHSTQTVQTDTAYPDLPIIVNFPVSATEVPVELLQVRYDGAFDYASPRYHSACYWVEYTERNYIPRRGGTNYTTAKGVSTYNLTANGLRVYFNVTNQVITGQVVGLPPYGVDVFTSFDVDRYTFDATTGTQVRLLNNTTSTTFQEIIQLEAFDTTSGLTSSQIRAGGLYTGLADGDYIFQTQRLDQVNPTVDITVSLSTQLANLETTMSTEPAIKQIRLQSPGTGNQNGDLILVTQEGSDMNCVFVYNDNLPVIDLPPYASVPYYKAPSDEQAWNRYSNVLSNATNLFDKQVLIELRNTNEQSMENITPFCVATGGGAPPTANIYKEDYDY